MEHMTILLIESLVRPNNAHTRVQVHEQQLIFFGYRCCTTNSLLICSGTPDSETCWGFDMPH
jgi:hypothetical protein